MTEPLCRKLDRIGTGVIGSDYVHFGVATLRTPQHPHRLIRQARRAGELPRRSGSGHPHLRPLGAPPAKRRYEALTGHSAKTVAATLRNATSSTPNAARLASPIRPTARAYGRNGGLLMYRSTDKLAESPSLRVRGKKSLDYKEKAASEASRNCSTEGQQSVRIARWRRPIG